jgi:hypothetical protein
VDDKHNPQGENMDGIVLALIALRNEFRPLQEPLTEHEFRLILTANREVRP